jgi:hypothetical protein
MKVWVYVEGTADKNGLYALWEKWRAKLKLSGWGIEIIPLDDKTRFFRKIGPRSAEKLLNNRSDLVVGLPDLYPNQPYQGSEYQHTDLDALKMVQFKLVQNALKNKSVDSSRLMDRFFPSAFKHDFEMLLLAAREELRLHLSTEDTLGNWRHPVEDQNQNHPPKRVVEELYRTKKRTGYRDTKDAQAVLGKVADINSILFDKSGQLQCPVFKEMLDWIGAKTNVPAY